MSTRVILFPGLGADERLFAPQLAAFPGVVEVPQRLLPATPREPLADYARRLVRRLDLAVDDKTPNAHGASHTQPATRRLIIGGSSFGSMLAVEVARIVRPHALVVVGGAPMKRGIPLLFRAGAFCARAMPTLAFTPMLWTGALVAPLFGARTRDERALFVEMLRACPLAFTAWAVRAIGSWAPAPLDGVDVHVIHGARDRILPARLVAKDNGDRGTRGAAPTIVDGAGHLLTWTHAGDVNRFLAGVIESDDANVPVSAAATTAATR